jgi:hypothetical protein
MKTRQLLAISLASLLCGCGSNSSLPVGVQVGKQCTVQFRGDALGAAGPMPIGLGVDAMGGTNVAMSGVLKEWSTQWIVISDKDAEYLIPVGVILRVTCRTGR